MVDDLINDSKSDRYIKNSPFIRDRERKGKALAEMVDVRVFGMLAGGPAGELASARDRERPGSGISRSRIANQPPPLDWPGGHRNGSSVRGWMVNRPARVGRAKLELRSKNERKKHGLTDWLTGNLLDLFSGRKWLIFGCVERPPFGPPHVHRDRGP